MKGIAASAVAWAGNRDCSKGLLLLAASSCRAPGEPEELVDASCCDQTFQLTCLLEVDEVDELSHTATSGCHSAAAASERPQAGRSGLGSRQLGGPCRVGQGLPTHTHWSLIKKAGNLRIWTFSYVFLKATGGGKVGELG